ncbi:MAG: hypothetical protein LBI74_00565 [Synergistaceae bacterium]|jgi:hypothetical protein|nr:hypothetical protein [Synergistaceae bacterium]
MDFIPVFAFFLIIVIIIYFMFGTRRTVLRVFGWAVFLFFFSLLILSVTQSDRPAEPEDIINDLRSLKSASLLFYVDFGTWPSPGQETSLDAYLDRPMVLADPPRYSSVTLINGVRGSESQSELYVRVELILERYRNRSNIWQGVQEYLARRANAAGLLQQPISSDVYKSGLNVYMRMH